MRLLLRTCLSSLVLAVLFAGGRVTANDGDVWGRDFDRAEADAKAQGRPLLVHFHAKWCGPCREMDAEVLHDATLAQQLRAGFVAVKVDGDERPDLVRRFRIANYPSDLFLDPNGYVLESSHGPRDRQTYLGLVARNEARFAQFRKAQIASQSKPAPSPATAPTASPAVLSSQDPGSRRALVAPSPIRSRPAERQDPALMAARNPTRPGPAPQMKKRPVNIGLRGYSPVALVSNRRWIAGSDKLAADYKGIVYHMATPEELRLFKTSPDHYAPQVLGCDPVILDISDRAVSGDIRYAAFFENELFLFVSDKSRQTFRQDPDRFVRTKHVLKVDELDDKQLR